MTLKGQEPAGGRTLSALPQRGVVEASFAGAVSGPGEGIRAVVDGCVCGRNAYVAEVGGPGSTTRPAAVARG